MTRKHPVFIVAALPYIFGGFSLLIFAVFLRAGNFNLVNFACVLPDFSGLKPADR